MKLLLDALLLVVAICPLGSDAIRIRGSNSRRYDPSNPSPGMLSFSCVDENEKSIQNAIWTRDNGPVNESFVQGGRLTLGIGTENPQSFEDRYYCNSNDLKNRSEPVSFYGKHKVVYKRSLIFMNFVLRSLQFYLAEKTRQALYAIS